MKVLILIFLLITLNYSQLTCGDNPAIGLFNALVAEAKAKIQDAIDNPLPDVQQQNGQPTPDQILADIEDLEAALTEYDTSSPSTYSESSSGIGHCGSLFTDGDSICCTSEIMNGISKLIQGKAHQYQRQRPKMLRFLQRAGNQFKECVPEGTIPAEADPQQNQLQAGTKSMLLKCQLQQILAQVRFLRGLSCAICVPPAADYTSSDYFSTETVTISIDGTDYTINKFKVNETSFDLYMETMVSGTECLTNFTDTMVNQFQDSLESFTTSSKCTSFKTDLQTFLDDAETVPCIGETQCKTHCKAKIQENPFRDGCATEGLDDDATVDEFSRILQDTETIVETSDGLDVQVVNETEDATLSIDGVTLYDPAISDGLSLLLFSFLTLMVLLIFVNQI